jgi:hypothetical protein
VFGCASLRVPFVELRIEHRLDGHQVGVSAMQTRRLGNIVKRHSQVVLGCQLQQIVNKVDDVLIVALDESTMTPSMPHCS